jgi:hypothetical protein
MQLWWQFEASLPRGVEMKSNRQVGTEGEWDVIRKIGCPSCGQEMQLLPSGFPLFDIQCKGCVFRAQVKTNACKPKDQIYGAGFGVLNHFLRSGQLIPPLIVSFRWREGRSQRQVILLYPFLTEANIRKKIRGPNGARPGYEEFNYVGLQDSETPKRILYET